MKENYNFITQDFNLQLLALQMFNFSLGYYYVSSQGDLVSLSGWNYDGPLNKNRVKGNNEELIIYFS